MALVASGSAQAGHDVVGVPVGAPVGSIAGTLIDDATGLPMAFVTVVLGGDAQPARKVLSNDRGVFEFTNLSDGRYLLVPEHPGYLLPPWRPGQPPRTIIVSGQRPVSGVELRLQRGGVIEGVVRDGNGRTPMDTSVHVWRCPSDILSCERLPGRPWSVDDRGRFRIFGLPPGDYVVSADARLVSDSIPVTRMSAADLDRIERSLSGGAAPALPSGLLGDSRPLTYVTTFAPTATDIGGASRIQIADGGLVSGVDVTMQSGTGATIAGHLSSGVQLSAPGTLSIFQDEPTTAMPPAPVVFVAGDGSFETAPVPPGAYRLVTKGTDQNGREWWTEQRVRLSGYDVTGIFLSFQPVVEMQGRAVLDTSSVPGVPTGPVRVELKRVDVGAVFSSIDRGSATTGDDGTFRVKSLLPGRYTLSVSAGASGAALWPKSVTAAGGRDLLDEPFEVSAASSTEELVVTLSARPSVLAGTVTDQDGRGLPEYLIVAFAVDPALRAFARRVNTSVVASDGSFRIEGLPEGEYFVGALGTSDPADVTDSLLAALALASRRVNLVWGETATIHLRLVTPSVVGGGD